MILKVVETDKQKLQILGFYLVHSNKWSLACHLGKLTV